MAELSARERIILAIDTSDTTEAERLAKLAADAGAKYVKLGLELSSATGWAYCANLAMNHGLGWVADAKLHDIDNTVAQTVRNIRSKSLKPFGITMHTTADIPAMQKAQEAAEDTKMLGVTVLTSVNEESCRRIYGKGRMEKVAELAIDASHANLAGLVCSPLEVGMVTSTEETSGLFTMIPGSRSSGAAHHDQANVDTPAATIMNGANLLVIGRQITQADNPAFAFEKLVAEIEGAMK
ncbi:orotidine-5'-phosphate decarboxylase [soil metagenome]